MDEHDSLDVCETVTPPEPMETLTAISNKPINRDLDGRKLRLHVSLKSPGLVGDAEDVSL